LDKSESVPAMNDTPATPPAPKTLGGWFAANLFPLAFVAGIVFLIIWRDLDILDIGKAVLGLGLVIFIHELGHFIAAKLCDVHVETFSIGFGKAIPGLQFKRGETTYKVGWIPLGGYVKMVGEGDNADTEEAEEDPRSFKNKSVWQRMIIISAGVFMNLVLGCVCFMVAYSHGVDETPAIVGGVGVGSPAWEEDVRWDTDIVLIDGIEEPTFDDIRPTVMSARKGRSVPFTLRERTGTTRDVNLVPRKNPEDLYPTVGVVPVEQLVLQKRRKNTAPVVRRNSPAAAAKAVQDGSGFEGGDRIVGMTDPANPSVVKPISLDPRDPTRSKLDAFEFHRNQYQLRGKQMTVRVDRGGQTLDFPLAPAWTQVLPGVQFQMGRIASMRKNGPAANAALVAPHGESGLQVARLDEPDSGDRIIAVEVTPGTGKKIRYVDVIGAQKDDSVEERTLDPLRLPYELERWAEEATDRTVRITVLRPATTAVKSTRRITFDMQWDPGLVFNGEISLSPGSPLAISGLGLAYFVETTVDSAPPAGSGLLKGDIVTEVRPRFANEKGEVHPGEWIPLKQYQGVYLHVLLQVADSPEFDLKVTRGAETDVEVAVTAVPDTNWPAVDRGFKFPLDTRLQKADNVWKALGMGLHRTWRTVKVIYQTLYATIFRQISAKTMSGPLSIANASYKIAGYDLWQFIIFIGLININLAVVNFLPIPLLDGGHMVFLLYEKIRGKPPPEKLVEWSLWGGLALILLLMAFVLYLDVRRLFF
jgi:regulator of sigma E protease